MQSDRLKFGVLGPHGAPVAYDYGNAYYRTPCGDTERLVIGPSSSQVELLDALASSFASQRYFILYVLLLSHSGRAAGRYQSPIVDSYDDLRPFLHDFRDFFESDGRHHVWIASPDSPDLLVYDQHNVIFAYGSLDAFEAELGDRGFEIADFWFPAPHVHAYHPENGRAEDQLMSYFEWAHWELQPGDEWD